MIRKKSRGQGLMGSDFILPCSRLEVPYCKVPKDEDLPIQLLKRNSEPEKGLHISQRQATEYLKCGMVCGGRESM